MSFLQTLASSIRSFWDVNTKTLVITDLTFMSADGVCIAGIDEQLTCVRPVVPHGIRRRQLFGSGRLIIFPRAKVAFDLSPAPIAPPHIEDQQFKPGSIAIQGVCSESEWEEVLRSICFPSVTGTFDGHVDGGRRVLPGAQTRSLGTISDVRVLNVRVDDSYGRRQFRMDFEDASGKRYSRFPISDLAFRAYLQESIKRLGDERKAEDAAFEALLFSQRIYLRIGLARPEQLGNYPLACWTQINGIYTFPDYLGGKTFADF